MAHLNEKALIEHGRFLKRLAASLLRDTARADDVVQEAWLAALRTGPTDAAALRPWLAGVVKNLVRRVRREEGRRAQREQVAARRDRARPTADIVAQEQTRRDLIGAVLALDEPYRTVMLMRFYDDLPPREIARQLGVNGSTVRTRLRRGIEELRGRLDSRYGDRRAWSLALIPVALESARTATAAGVSSALWKGVLTMKPKLIAVFIPLCVLAVLLLWQVGQGSEAPRSSERPEPAIIAHDATGPAPSASVVPADRPAEEPPPLPTLRGVVRLPDGLQGQDVRLVAAAGRARVAATVSGAFELNIAALFADRVPSTILVTAEHPATLPAEAKVRILIDPASARPIVPELDLALRLAAITSGRVAHGTVALAEVMIAAFPLDGGVPAEHAVAHTRSGEVGGYRLALAEGGEYLIVAVDAAYRPQARTVSVRAGERVDLPVFDLERGNAITGRVTVNGSPARAGVVKATAIETGLRLKIVRTPFILRYADGAVEHAVTSGRCDDGGRYRIEALVPGAYHAACSSIKNGHSGLLSLPAAKDCASGCPRPRSTSTSSSPRRPWRSRSSPRGRRR